MAFQQPTVQRQSFQPIHTASSTQSLPQQQPQPSDSQEWILFAPESHVDSSTDRTEATRTQGLSHTSDLGYFDSTARSAQPGSSILDDDATEDAELDSLDEGLHAFREPVLYNTATHQTNGPVLPAHDGLGSFQASSAPVLEQLWRHEQFNTKRKHEGHHRSLSSVQRHLDTVDELEAQASEEKRLRIEKWRIEQSQALLEEVEKETRRKTRRRSTRHNDADFTSEDIFGTTPKQSDFTSNLSKKPISIPSEDEVDSEPFWRRITRKFIKDIIGIDDPLLSVILGESLPGDATPRAASPIPEEPSSQSTETDAEADASWRDKLLQRIAHELGVFPSQLTPHPGAFTTYTVQNADYAGMPVSSSTRLTRSIPQETSRRQNASQSHSSTMNPNFPPTLRDTTHAESWGLEEEPPSQNADQSLNLDKEREYWERELDVKMVFRFLRDRFITRAAPVKESPSQPFRKDDSAARAAIIRQHHPLVNRSHRSPARLRQESRASVRRPSSSCASESLKGSRKASALRSGSSRNYWDIGGSLGSGSVIASGGMIGAWGHT